MISTLSISTIIRGTILVLFLLALFRLTLLFEPYVVMSPAAVWPGLELWRLLTYPLALNFGGLLIGAICFSQPGEEIENMLGKKQFGSVLLALTLVVSVLYTLMFFMSPGPELAGPQNLALFVLVGYVYLFPGSSVRIIFFSVNSKTLLLVLGLLAIGLGIIPIVNGESPLVLLGEGAAGLIAGALWFHIRYQKYPFLLGPLRSIAGMFRGKQDIAVQKSKPVKLRVEKSEQKQGTGKLSDEERLDAILEKISKSGYNSLGKDERAFLDEYSSKL